VGQQLRKDKAKETIETILQGYKKYLQSKEIRSISDRTFQVKAFLKWCEDQSIIPQELTEEHAHSWMIYLVERPVPLSRGTINGRLSIIKNFYHFLRKAGYIGSSPFFYIHSLSTGRTLPRDIPEVQDMETLLSNLSILSLGDLMMRPVIELLYGSALRISELEILKLEDLDFVGGMITIYESKTNRVRRVPATESSFHSLQKYIDKVRPQLLNPQELSAGYLFPQGAKTTLRCRINNKLKRECARLKLPKMTSHSFRHAAATHMLKAGAGIKEVQSFLGHQKITSTEIYTHLVKEDLKQVVHNHHPREKRNL
jgi:site-specific recombinase XerD